MKEQEKAFSDHIPVESAFAGAEFYENEGDDWDTLLGKDLTERSQRISWHGWVRRGVITGLAILVVLLGALLMIRSGTAKKAAFLDRNIALLTADSPYYHSYGCEYLDEEAFSACTIEEAQEHGYMPCPECHHQK